MWMVETSSLLLANSFRVPILLAADCRVSWLQLWTLPQLDLHCRVQHNISLLPTRWNNLGRSFFSQPRPPRQLPIVAVKTTQRPPGWLSKCARSPNSIVCSLRMAMRSAVKKNAEIRHRLSHASHLTPPPLEAQLACTWGVALAADCFAILLESGKLEIPCQRTSSIAAVQPLEPHWTHINFDRDTADHPCCPCWVLQHGSKHVAKPSGLFDLAGTCGKVLIVVSCAWTCAELCESGGDD
jgi:hypothetical protein